MRISKIYLQSVENNASRWISSRCNKHLKYSSSSLNLFDSQRQWNIEKDAKSCVNTHNKCEFHTEGVNKSVHNDPFVQKKQNHIKSENLNSFLNIQKKFLSSTAGNQSESLKKLNFASNENLILYMIIDQFRKNGHLLAKIDPLELSRNAKSVPKSRYIKHNLTINCENFGITESDLDKEVSVNFPGMEGFLSESMKPMKLRDLLNRLNEIYCDTIGIDISHINDTEVQNFFHKFFETTTKVELSSQEKKELLKNLCEIELFEVFCSSKFKTAKRFGVEGCESGVAVVKALIKHIMEKDGEAAVLGMGHRGRLNVLVNVLMKPIKSLMCEFLGIYPVSNKFTFSGDVKYHLGYHNMYENPELNKKLRLNLLPNASHLETVYPIVLGKCKAQQYLSNDKNYEKAYSIVIHGDASLAGQGVCYEGAQMSQLDGYNVGGSIHIVFNNQVGFTTDVESQSTSQYPSSVAKVIDAPMFHVNADDPEACVKVARAAFEYRNKFKKDVYINVVGYRKNGHNELDMPNFTQPEMYSSVSKHPSVLTLYSEKLIKEGTVTKDEFQKMQTEVLNKLNDEYNQAKASKKENLVVKKPYEDMWNHMYNTDKVVEPIATGLPLSKIKELGSETAKLPSAIVPHNTIAKTYSSRLESMTSGKDVDYGLGEALAFASLLNDGFHIRISGQDAQRGTFSHRHCVVHDQKSFQTYVPLQELAKNRKLKSDFVVNNSPLNEYAALCYEFGYSLEDPNVLCLWEAQFGDFANGAQIAIDQYLVSSESKWDVQNGLVLLLPHGYDGQGPEHSSCRIERFLQLSNEREDIVNIKSNVQDWNDRQFNLYVVNCSTPANYFHLLRRQMLQPKRKPLVVISPKKMLKMRSAFSKLQDMDEGTQFQPYITNITQNDKNINYSSAPHQLPIDESIERIILCSGQVYYDLEAYREKHGLWNVAIARVEQLTPFPYNGLVTDLSRYPNLRDVAWVQEEPMNAGPWTFTSKRIMACLEYLNYPNGITHPLFIGRDASGSPAVGDASRHNDELNTILNESFDIYRRSNSYVQRYHSESATEAKNKTAQKSS